MCFETCEGSVPRRTADQVLVRFDTGFMERALVASQSCLSRCVAHIPKDMGDATMSKLDQVASGQPGAFGIIVGDSGIAEAFSSGLSMQTQGTPHSNTVASRLSVWESPARIAGPVHRPCRS